MGVCNESGRKRSISDTITNSSNNSSINKKNTSNQKGISSTISSQVNKTNKSLNHKGLIST